MVLTMRLDGELARALAAVAKREGCTRSEVAREAIQRYVASVDIVAEARQQSLRVSRGAPERAAARFVERAAELDDWK